MVSPRSAPLTNMEPHKCEEWKWVKWEEIIKIKKTAPHTLFDPIRHMLNDLGDEKFVK